REPDGVGYQENGGEHDDRAQKETRNREQADVLLHLDQEGLVEDDVIHPIPALELGDEPAQAVRIGVARAHTDLDGGRQKRLIQEDLGALAKFLAKDATR